MSEADGAAPADVGAAHRRPEGASDELVEAVGKVSEAFEWIERARGSLYEFHHKMGRADFLFADAADALEELGHDQEAASVRSNVVGRNVLDGRWTFQIMEEFDDVYYGPVRKVNDDLRDALMDGKPHVYEAELKAARRADPRNVG